MVSIFSKILRVVAMWSDPECMWLCPYDMYVLASKKSFSCDDGILFSTTISSVYYVEMVEQVVERLWETGIMINISVT